MSRTYNTDPYVIQRYRKSFPHLKIPKNWRDWNGGYAKMKQFELDNPDFDRYYFRHWNYACQDERGKTEFRRALNREYRNKNKHNLRNGDYETLRWRRNVDWNWYW